MKYIYIWVSPVALFAVSEVSYATEILICFFHYYLNWPVNG